MAQQGVSPGTAIATILGSVIGPGFQQGLDAGRQRMLERKRMSAVDALTAAVGAQPGATELDRVIAGVDPMAALKMQTGRQQALSREQEAFGERLGTAAGGILGLPETEGRAAWERLVPQLRSEAQALGLPFDDEDAAWNPAALQGMAAKYGKLPEGLEPTTTARNLEAAGLPPGSPEFKAAMLKAVTKPQVQVNTGKLPPGFIPNDPQDLTKGIRPIPGGPQDPKSKTRKRPVGEAQTISAARSALGEISDVKGVLFSADGRLNRGEVFEGSEILGIGGFPGSSGRKTRQKVQRAIETVLRAKSGAAVPETELARFMNMFFPSILDSDDAAKDKISALEQFLSGTLQELDAAAPQEEPSQEDLEFTAKKHGITVEEVKRRLKNAP